MATLPLLQGCQTAPRAVARASTSAAVQVDAEKPYFDPASIDLTRLLPPFPANESSETRAELDLMMKIQTKRSPTEAARAKDDAQASVYRFADALGAPAGFTAQNLPLTDALFNALRREEVGVIGVNQARFARPRPFVLEPRLEPVIAKPANGSYPSGHTTWARMVALVLADMIPERRAQILARADEYSYNRVVAGVHYPSDIDGGKLSGTVLAAALFASPRFQSDLAAAQSELRQALNLPAQPH
ncbi:MAG TPA: phosphatase PAP2 family protein [Steroidobacteraceae bacterium]|nr:phosphatase PAP2 family protein [Steroidobacteraceae bacterium]